MRKNGAQQGRGVQSECFYNLTSLVCGCNLSLFIPAFGARDLSFAGSVGPLTSSLRRSEDKDKYWDLVEQVRGLEASEKELKDRVEELRKEDADQLIKVWNRLIQLS